MLPSETRTLERIAPPSPGEFARRYVATSTPVVLTGLLDAWPAFGRWSLDYLREAMPGRRVGALPVRSWVLDIDARRGSRLESVGLEDCLDAMGRMSGPAADGFYLCSPVDGLPEHMRGDLAEPPYCTGPWRRSTFFAGMPGTVTPLHQDLPENLYAMLGGRKRWTLYPPRPGSIMYRYNPLFGAPNHSRVDPESPDYERFPKFRRAKPVVVDIEAGEVLFLPSRWWHHVRALGPEPSISVNFWWATGLVLPIAWIAAAYKRWRRI
jgi:lysine-specific demethylase 8